MQMMGKTNADRIDLRVFQEMTPVLMERNADHLAIAWSYDGIGYANHIQLWNRCGGAKLMLPGITPPDDPQAYRPS